DSMIRDLVEASMRLSKQKRMDENSEMADKIAEDIIVKAIIPGGHEEKQTGGVQLGNIFGNLGYKTQKQEYEEKQKQQYEQSQEYSDIQMAREQVREQLRSGALEEEIIEIEVDDVPKTNQLDMQNEGMIAIGNIFDNMMPKKTKRKKCKVKDARRILREQEAQKLIDMDQVTDEALQNAEQNGIIFIDEIDKIASGSSMRSGADVSREGVQRDILPIVEGSVVNTKYGPVKTDHMLFIGAGAFHVSKPSDLIPELQGRFPINVELKNLDRDDFRKILTVPENAVTKQQKALLETEGVHVEFTEDGIDEIANLAYLMNEETENIGARRLHTILEILLEEISYNLPDPELTDVVVDRAMVQDKLHEKVKEVDVDRYIL
ncbi:MAG: ATP-dependent protease ATPase subunit HslU, partial [Spirochaetales bacterium]|nr:ATP-dependent protease ATPase subunit HslU [Spirochaetales bacterium]